MAHFKNNRQRKKVMAKLTGFSSTFQNIGPTTNQKAIQQLSAETPRTHISIIKNEIKDEDSILVFQKKGTQKKVNPVGTRAVEVEVKEEDGK